MCQILWRIFNKKNCSTPQPSGSVSDLVKNIKAELPMVQVFVTSPSTIPESQMSNSVHILTRSNPEQRRTDVIRDGFTYKWTATKKKFPPFLGSNQQVAVYNCVGRLICLNPDCDVFKRWTYCNSVPNQKDTPATCRFCSTGSGDSGLKLVENLCSGKKWVITSPDSKHVISYYLQEHSCGKADFVVSEEVLNQLQEKFESNSRLTSGQAFRQLVEEKIRKMQNTENAESKNKIIADMMSLVQACIHDHVPKNVKQKAKKSASPHGTGIEAVLELKKLFASKEVYDKMPISIVVVLDSYVCPMCKSKSCAQNVGDKIYTHCTPCDTDMQHTGPQVLVTSRQQLQNAAQMSTDNGVFARSTVFADHQPGRVLDYNTLVASHYDHNIQQMAVLFTCHGSFEDQFSVFLGFLLFEETMQEVLKNDNLMFHPNDILTFNPYGFNTGKELSAIVVYFIYTIPK